MLCIIQTMEVVKRLDNTFDILQSGDDARIGELQLISINFICFLISESQERGAFTLDQAYELKLIVDRLSGKQREEGQQIHEMAGVDQQKKDVGFLFDCVEIAQKKGVLNLKEAHYAYLAIQSFISQKI